MKKKKVKKFGSKKDVEKSKSAIKKFEEKRDAERAAQLAKLPARLHERLTRKYAPTQEEKG